jgi:hypothetical protein
MIDQATILVAAALEGLDKIQIQKPVGASKESWTSLRVNRDSTCRSAETRTGATAK